MKPTRAQLFFARSRPLQALFLLLFIGAPLCFAYIVASLLSRVYQPLSAIENLLRLGFFVIVALLLGFLVALVAGSLLAFIIWPVLGPLYRARGAMNGAPFRVGDYVQILVGRHKGRIVRVYSDWRDDCVRVELGEKEKEKFNDIFDSIQLLRENVDPNVVPNGSPGKLSEDPEASGAPPAVS